jgi:hypothetical protein
MDFSRFSCARMRARDVKVPLRSYHCGNDPARGTRGRGLRISSLVAGDPAVQESNIAGALLRGHVSRRGGNFCFEVGELFVCHRSLPVGCPLEEIESLEFHAHHARPFHTFKECGVPRESGRRCSAWAGSRCRCHRALRGSHFRRLSFTTTLAGISVNARLRSRRTLADSVEACNALSIAECAMPLASEAPWAIRPA